MKVIYWVATIAVVIACIGGGVIGLLRQPPFSDIIRHLGYPNYFTTILGISYVLAGLALLIPGWPRVGHPGRIGVCRGESALQEIRNEHRWLPDDAAPNAVPMQRTEIGLAHQPLYAMLAAGLARFTEIEEDPRGPVDAMARHKRGANEAQQPRVFLRAI